MPRTPFYYKYWQSYQCWIFTPAILYFWQPYWIILVTYLLIYRLKLVLLHLIHIYWLIILFIQYSKNQLAIKVVNIRSLWRPSWILVFGTFVRTFVRNIPLKFFLYYFNKLNQLSNLAWQKRSKTHNGATLLVTIFYKNVAFFAHLLCWGRGEFSSIS